eukprot:11168081-Lingulodinium_polyedra.AAC.1
METFRRGDLAPGSATVAGDNLGIVRYCAGTGALCDPELHGILDGASGRAACQARRLAWLAVRR